MFEPIDPVLHRDLHSGDGRRTREGVYAYLISLKKQADDALRTERDTHSLAQWQGAGLAIDRLIEAITIRPDR